MRAPEEVVIDLVLEDVVAIAPPSLGAAIYEVDIEAEALEVGGDSVGAGVWPREEQQDAPREASRAYSRRQRSARPRGAVKFRGEVIEGL